MACITFLMPAGELLGIYYNNIVLVILNLMTLFISLYISFLIIVGIHDLKNIENIKLGFVNLILVCKIKAILQIMCTLLSYLSSSTTPFILALLTSISILINIIFLVLLYQAKTKYENINKN